MRPRRCDPASTGGVFRDPRVGVSETASCGAATGRRSTRGAPQRVPRGGCRGKGTLYRRYPDRAAVAVALLDEHERRLQQQLVTRPPSPGPGAPPADRLAASTPQLLELLDQTLPCAAPSQRRHGDPTCSPDRATGRMPHRPAPTPRPCTSRPARVVWYRSPLPAASAAAVSIRCSSVTRCSRCSGDNSPSWTPRLPREVVPHPGADRAPWEHGRRGAPAQGLARLRAATSSGELDALCASHHIRVLTVYGSAARG